MDYPEITRRKIVTFFALEFVLAGALAMAGANVGPALVIAGMAIFGLMWVWANRRSWVPLPLRPLLGWALEGEHGLSGRPNGGWDIACRLNARISEHLSDDEAKRRIKLASDVNLLTSDVLRGIERSEYTNRENSIQKETNLLFNDTPVQHARSLYVGSMRRVMNEANRVGFTGEGNIPLTDIYSELLHRYDGACFYGIAFISAIQGNPASQEFLQNIHDNKVREFESVKGDTASTVKYFRSRSHQKNNP